MELDPTKYIPEFYKGRSIFITGGTGFMGKVLIEKLLRSCPDLEEIFLLMRPRNEISIDNRLRKMLALPLFDKIREKDSSIFEKLIPITGDVMEEGLGLPVIERRVLIERVSVIFHVAANVRFDDPLKQAILMNTRGTRDVCILAASMKKLVVLLHVSTTYGNTDRPVIDEVLYPPHTNWKEAIKTAENVDEHTLNIMTGKYIGKLPNTYTFTKQISEHVINDYSGVIPSVIFRPSVVISTFEEPIKGWVDNLNGPVGLMLGGGKGILRTVYGNPDVLIDFMPVDIAIKAILVTAWKRGVTTITKDPTVSIYNCSSCGIKSIANKELLPFTLGISKEIPMDNILWVPSTKMDSVRWIYFIHFMILQLIPALIVDAVLKLSGTKPRLIKLQRKIFAANFALKYFLLEHWKFSNKKLSNLLTTLPDINKPEFYYNMGLLDMNDYFKDCVIGCKVYLLKEDMKRLPLAKAHYNRLWWIDAALKVWFAIVVCWVTISSGLLVKILNIISSMFDF